MWHHRVLFGPSDSAGVIPTTACWRSPSPNPANLCRASMPWLSLAASAVVARRRQNREDLAPARGPATITIRNRIGTSSLVIRWRNRRGHPTTLNVLPGSLTNLTPPWLASAVMQLIQEPNDSRQDHAMQHGCAAGSGNHSRQDSIRRALAFSSELGPRDPFSFLVLGDSVPGVALGAAGEPGPMPQGGQAIEWSRATRAVSCCTPEIWLSGGLQLEQYRRNSFVPTGDWLVGGGSQRRESPMTRMTFHKLLSSRFSVITTITICPAARMLSWITGPLEWAVCAL